MCRPAPTNTAARIGSMASRLLLYGGGGASVKLTANGRLLAGRAMELFPQRRRLAEELHR